MLHPFIALVLLVTTFFGSAFAQSVPSLVNYQGRLANPDGSPLPTADYTLTFNLYDAATNGALVWGPQVFDGAVAQGHGARIPVVQGYFNVMLGPQDTTGRSLSDAFSNPTRYVEVTVSNRPPIAPRQQILTTPFAFQAANSAKLAGYDWSAVFGTNDPVAGTIPLSKLAQRPVGTNVGAGGIAVSEEFNSPAVMTTSITPIALQVQLRSTGRPTWVGLISGTNGLPYANIESQTTHDGGIRVHFLRNGVTIATPQMMIQAFGASGMVFHAPLSVFQCLDLVPPAGVTNIYSVSLQSFENNDQVNLNNVRLVAFEL